MRAEVTLRWYNQIVEKLVKLAESGDVEAKKIVDDIESVCSKESSQTKCKSPGNVISVKEYNQNIDPFNKSSDDGIAV